MKLPFPTIAAINGHFLAGGFMFAMAHDYRILIDKKIKSGMTEINLGMTIPVPMLGSLMAKLNKSVLRNICVFGENYDA